MRTIVRIPVWLVFAVFLVQGPATAQTSPLRTLTKPDAEYPEPFISIRGVRELKDGRVIVAEVHLRDGTLQVVNFATGTASPVSRKGSGPGEFDGRPSRLLAFAGDTTVMYDGGNARFLLIGPDAKPAGTQLTSPTQWTYNLEWGDARGRVYAGLDARMISPTEVADSAPIVRYALASKKLDTVAIRRVSKTDLSTYSGQDMAGFRTEEVPFAVHDDWAAFPDGRVAVIRGSDYHVDFYLSNGSKVSARPTRFVSIPVTDVDKDSVRAARRPKPGPDGKITLPKLPLILEPSVWYPTKAPFGENSTWAGPDGELWVAIALKAGDKSPKFDVFDVKGVRRITVALPIGSRVIGFGAHAVYTIRTDADDQQYLQRFDLKK